MIVESQVLKDKDAINSLCPLTFHSYLKKHRGEWPHKMLFIHLSICIALIKPSKHPTFFVFEIIKTCNVYFWTTCSLVMKPFQNLYNTVHATESLLAFFSACILSGSNSPKILFFFLLIWGKLWWIFVMCLLAFFKAFLEVFLSDQHSNNANHDKDNSATPYTLFLSHFSHRFQTLMHWSVFGVCC